MNRLISILTIVVIVISCKTGKIVSGKNETINDTIRFTMRVLPDNGWFLTLYPDSEYKYVHFSGFSGIKIIETGSYTIENKHIIFNSRDNESEFSSMNYYIYKAPKKGKYIEDKSKKYCLIIR